MKTKIILVTLVLALSIGCEKEFLDFQVYDSYDEYFNTSGIVVIDNDTLNLEFGNLRNIGTHKNSQVYVLSLYNITRSPEDDEPNSESMEQSYVSLRMDINSHTGKSLTEGDYAIDNDKTRLPFTICTVVLSVSNKSDTDKTITNYEFQEGTFQVVSYNVYPYTGLPSVLVNLNFQFNLNDKKNISGNFVGRVITSENVDE